MASVKTGVKALKAGYCKHLLFTANLLFFELKNIDKTVKI